MHMLEKGVKWNWHLSYLPSRKSKACSEGLHTAEIHKPQTYPCCTGGISSYSCPCSILYGRGHSFSWGARGYCRLSPFVQLDWKCYHSIWSHGSQVGCFRGVWLGWQFLLGWGGLWCWLCYYLSKSNKSTALYSSCFSVAVTLLLHLNPFELPTAAPNSMTVPSNSHTDDLTTNCIISFLHCLCQLIQQVSHSSIGMFLSKQFAVADTRATNHIPHASGEGRLHLIQIYLQPPNANEQ